MATIRNVRLEDRDIITEIYNYYVENTIITFDEELYTPEDMAHKIETIIGEYPFIVLEEEGSVIGYAYGSRYRPKNAYRFTVEVTIYLKSVLTGRGYGSMVFERLLVLLKEAGYHNCVGVLGLPNPKSQSLHEKFMFKKIGHQSEAGFKFDRWIDVGFWERIL